MLISPADTSNSACLKPNIWIFYPITKPDLLSDLASRVPFHSASWAGNLGSFLSLPVDNQDLWILIQSISSVWPLLPIPIITMLIQVLIIYLVSGCLNEPPDWSVHWQQFLLLLRWQTIIPLAKNLQDKIQASLLSYLNMLQ